MCSQPGTGSDRVVVVDENVGTPGGEEEKKQLPGKGTRNVLSSKVGPVKVIEAKKINSA